MRDDHEGRWPCDRCGRWLLPVEGHYRPTNRPNVQTFVCRYHEEN